MADILEYKCPSCGAPIKYDGSRKTMHCEFCEQNFDLETLQKYNVEIQSSSRQDEYDWGDSAEREQLDKDMSMQVLSCSSCGAEIVCDEHTVARECLYCGNTNIFSQQISGLYKPDCLIPFKINKEQAKQALREHYKGKSLLPDLFTSENRIDSITGIYVPFWLFDGKALADMSFRCTKTIAWEDSSNRYVKTDYYLATSAGDFDFTRIPVDGSSTMDDTLMEAIEPFNYEELAEFKAAYLSGYFTDKYDVDHEQSIPRANERVKNTAEQLLREQHSGYDTMEPEQSRLEISDGQVHYALLPVWMLNTKYKDKIYHFAMNAQTGKFIGDLPIDTGKLYKRVGLTFIASTVVLYGIAALMNFV